MEAAVDKYEDRLGTYLVKITSRELSEKQTQDASKFLHTIGDFERISDHALNVAEAARRSTKRGSYSPTRRSTSCRSSAGR